MSAARDLPLETIRLDQDNRVLTAIITNPPLNLANPLFLRELELLTKAVDRDLSIGAVVLTGGLEGRFPPTPTRVTSARWSKGHIQPCRWASSNRGCGCSTLP